eukprot:tig00021432_g21246.t1
MDISKFLDRRPRNTQFAIAAGSVLVLYQAHSYIQELIFTVEGFDFAFFMVGVSFVLGLALSTLERMREGCPTKVSAPAKWYAVIGALLLVSMGLSNASLNYCTYPILVVFKSAKVIPVMLVGTLLLGKKYKLMDYASALCFFVGLASFTLVDVRVQAKFSWTGVAVLLLALLADAFIGNAQEKLLRAHKCSLTEMVQWTYLAASLLCVGYVAWSGELAAALRFCSGRPELYALMLVFGFFSYLGTYAVLVLVERFGAVTCVVVTSCRKLLTIVLSFLLFPKALHVGHLLATGLLAAGMLLEGYAKNPVETRAFLLRLVGRPAPPAPAPPAPAPEKAFFEGRASPDGPAPARPAP